MRLYHAVIDVEFSPDGQALLAAYSEGPIRVMDVESGREVGRLEGHSDGMPGVVFSHDGQMAASAGWDGQAIIWDVQSRSILHRLSNHQGPLGQVRFTPDSLFLLGGGVDGTGSLWDVKTGAVVRRYNHGGFMRIPDFSPDGREALVAFQGGRVERWRIDRTLEELLNWTKANRSIPELTCEQRELYLVESLCEPEEG